MKAPLPENEAERLAALRGFGILDTPPELAYDELSSLAAYICQTPIALISLVDEDRQWFKSRVGWTSGETPREVAFCAHAILQPDLLVVPDASADERFAQNPLVTSPPSIRFYAGAPLLTTEGHALGTLCVIDHKPRELTAEQASALRVLSHQVVAQLRLHKQLAEQSQINAELSKANETLRVVVAHRQRAEQALRESEQRLELSLQISKATSFEINLVTGEGVTHGPWTDSFGYAPGSIPRTLDAWAALVHPEDAPAREAAFQDHLAGRTPLYLAEYRVRSRSGTWVWIYSCGRVVERDTAGRPTRLIGTVMDVSDRKRIEDDLRENERQMNSILSHLPGLAYRCLVDRDWTCLYAAGRFRPIGGFDAEDLVAGRVAYGEILHPDDADSCARNVAEALTRRAPYENEHRIFDREGKVKWILSRGRGLFTEDGTLRCLEGLNIDITSQKKAEEELRKANDRLGLAVRGSQVGVWENDMAGGDYWTGRVLCINIMEPLGYLGPAAAIDWDSATAPIERADLARVQQALCDYLAGRAPVYQVEFRARHRDGSCRWMLSRGVAVRDAAGRPIRIVGTRIDITQLKQTEEERSRLTNQLRLLLESSGEGIYGIDLDGRCTFINRAGAQMLGYRPEQALGRDMHELIHHSRCDGTPYPVADCPIFRAFRIGTACRVSDEVLWRQDGSHFPAEYSSFPILDDGRRSGAVITFTDISERKRTEAELKQAKETAEQASRAKSEFLAHVSHEVRTPLNAILGMTELSLDTPVTGQQRKHLSVVRSAAEALLDLIDDLLDFSKIEAGKLELDRATFSLRAVLNDTLRSLALRAHRKGLELVGHVCPEVPDAFVGDAGRLRQVLTNLVGNAIKFTAEGEVVVSVEALEAANDPGQGEALEPESPPSPLLFSVRDTGIGIPREKQLRIFEAFEQADSSTTRRFGGTGLGLSIAARLVGLMGGRISVESEPGRGSAFLFTVRLPRPLLQPNRAVVKLPEALSALPVLIVDDNAASRRTLEEYLRAWRVAPAAVGDAPAALKALRQAAVAGRPFALVVLDSHLSGSDALAVAAQIRQSAELATSEVVLLTTEDQAWELGRYQELGIAACVMKPVQEEELLDAICRARGLPSPVVQVRGKAATEYEPEFRTADVPAFGRRLHILVAEDNPYNQAVMEDLLPRRGHTVHITGDGQAALAALEHGQFDVLLLDIHMPELDGFQVVAVQRQREQGTGRHLPVIALTARSADGEREHCMRAGMDDYLAKPVRAAELFAAIDRVVSGEGNPRPVESDGGIPTGLIDSAALLAGCGGDAELLRKMRQHFQNFVPGRLAEVSEALRDGDTRRLQEAVHKLGGMISSFSATAAEATALLGRLGSEGKIEEAIQAHARLTELVRRLNLALETLSLDQLQRQRENSVEIKGRH
jgi:PAS domain S-box-containing protein